MALLKKINEFIDLVRGAGCNDFKDSNTRIPPFLDNDWKFVSVDNSHTFNFDNDDFNSTILPKLDHLSGKIYST